MPTSDQNIREQEDLFAKCAAPEAILAMLDKHRAARKTADRQIVKLEALLVRRSREVAEGTWPPPPDEEALRMRNLGNGA